MTIKERLKAWWEQEDKTGIFNTNELAIEAAGWKQRNGLILHFFSFAFFPKYVIDAY